MGMSKNTRAEIYLCYLLPVHQLISSEGPYAWTDTQNALPTWLWKW